MDKMLRTISVSSNSDLAHELGAAQSAARSIAIDTGDTIYEVFVSRSQPAAATDDSSARSIAGIRDAAGSWGDIDTEALEAYRDERRKLHTRPPVNL
jgi:hypothetical protein